MTADSNRNDRALAYALLRLVLGVNISMHGLSRLMAPDKFVHAIQSQFVNAPLPHFAVTAFAISLPWAEAVLGLLLVAGWRTRFALVGGSLLMAVLTFGSCLLQDWSAAGTQLLYAFVYAALLFLFSYNGWSVDALLQKRSGRA
ncbi:MAG TPA: MauE/DoxX family redox-associated membrane protein [Terracidiphilus sp.]|nr:MauE/DoxX family redox-associated membrane protein [Terracidiphilus sp.]